MFTYSHKCFAIKNKTKISYRSHSTTMGYTGECDSDFIRTTALEDSVHMKLFF